MSRFSTAAMILVLVSFLPACRTALPKPSQQPMVDCRQRQTDEVPPAPAGSLKEWVERGPGWAVDVLEVLTLERQYRRLEHDCYRDQQEKQK